MLLPVHTSLMSHALRALDLGVSLVLVVVAEYTLLKLAQLTTLLLLGLCLLMIRTLALLVMRVFGAGRLRLLRQSKLNRHGCYLSSL